MTCITKLLELKGASTTLKVNDSCVIEGGGMYKDYEYIIVFVDRGHRCGYVAVKEQDANYFKDEKKEEYYYPGLQVHGGVTFYSSSHAAKDLLPMPCDDFWIGFDAAHFYDKPDLKTAEEYFGDTKYIRFLKENYHLTFSENEKHRGSAYMEKECHGLIDQLIKGPPYE